ncbi:HTH_Tnp_Tc3_2 domain-containing protein [Trichonephila clavipes]|nr:HTH_Tnp_Tc3_2 domain-containing protein [Trichonephila clavipes]
MPLRRFRRQYEQLSQIESEGGIIGLMEAGWSARRVARQLDHSDCVVRRCRDHQLLHRQPSSHNVAPSLGTPVSSRTIRRLLAEGRLGSRRPLRGAALDAHPSTPPFGVVPRARKLDCSEMEPSCL